MRQDDLASNLRSRPPTPRRPGCEPSASLARSCCSGSVLSRCRHVAGNAATIAGMKRTDLQQSALASDAISYSGYRFPHDVISYAVWLHYRFPLSLRMVEELMAARGIDLTYASANAGAREGDAPFKISAPPAAIYVGARSGGEPVHALPLQHERAREALGTHAGRRGVGGRDRTFDAGSSCCITQDYLRSMN